MDKKVLDELLSLKTKHSQYQKLPSCLEGVLEGPEVGKYEKERMNYVCDKVDIIGNVLDIGGNSGYFTFESITRGKADHVDYYEGNKNHADFVKLAAEYTDLSAKIGVHNEYYIPGDSDKQYDVGFYLNVVHHLGKDYECGISIEEAKERMMNEVNALAKYVKIMVFQIGFNWGGDVNFGLFPNGTKKEMIDFVKEKTAEAWEIEHIGIAMENNGTTVYENLSDSNIARMNHLGEFRNRPLFIMKSKVLN